MSINKKNREELLRLYEEKPEFFKRVVAQSLTRCVHDIMTDDEKMKKFPEETQELIKEVREVYYNNLGLIGKNKQKQLRELF